MNQTGSKVILRKTIDKSGEKNLNNGGLCSSKFKLSEGRKKSHFSKQIRIIPNHKALFTEKLITKNEEKIKEFLSNSFNENDFDDVIDKEKRTFFQFFCEKFQENQIIIYIFYIKQPLRPRPLKILVFILTIEINLVVNALFYTEEYISEVFRINSGDSFFAFVPRRLNHFAYIYVVIGFISYILSYFFIEEKKIKKIFLRNKSGEIKIKYDILMAVNDINKRFQILYAISFLVTIIGFIYISCFNVVYPNSKIEWIKSSIFIFIFMQFISYVIVFLECSIRYIAIKCNSNKLFRLSLIFD